MLKELELDDVVWRSRRRRSSRRRGCRLDQGGGECRWGCLEERGGEEKGEGKVSFVWFVSSFSALSLGLLPAKEGNTSTHHRQESDSVQT